MDVTLYNVKIVKEFSKHIGLIIGYFNYIIPPKEKDQHDTLYWYQMLVITNHNKKIPCIPLKKDCYKFKKVAMEYCREKYRLRKKNLVNIKHLYNKNDVHYYLVILNRSGVGKINRSLLKIPRNNKITYRFRDYNLILNKLDDYKEKIKNIKDFSLYSKFDDEFPISTISDLL
jgi:hypothetical protein